MQSIENLIDGKRYEETYDAFEILRTELKAQKQWEHYFEVLFEEFSFANGQDNLEHCEAIIKIAEAQNQRLYNNTVTSYLGDTYLFRTVLGYMKADFPNSIENGKKAVPIFQQFGEVKKEAMTHRWLSIAFDLIGEVDSSIVHLQKAIALFKSLDDDDLEPALLGKCLTYLGGTYAYEQQKEKAVETLNEAMRYALANKDSITLAESYGYFAYLAIQDYKFQEALEYYFKSINLMSAVKGEDYTGIGVSFNGIGTLYYAQSNFEDAKYFFEKSNRLDIEEYGVSHPYTLNTAMNIANCLKALGLHEEATIQYNKILQYIPEDSNYGTLRFTLLINKAKNYWTAGDTTNAVDQYTQLYEQRYDILEEGHPYLIELYQDLAAIADKEVVADRHINQVIALLSDQKLAIKDIEQLDLEYIDHYDYLLNVIGLKIENVLKTYEIENDPKHLERASTYASKGLEVFDFAIQTAVSPEQQAALIQNAQNYLQIVLRLFGEQYEISTDQANPIEVFNTIERYRALQLNRGISAKKINLRASAGDSLLSKESALIAKIAETKQPLANDKLAVNVEDSTAILSEVADLRNELTQVQDQIAEKYPQLTNDFNESLMLRDIQPYLENGTALIEYFLEDRGLTILATTKDTALYHYQKLAPEFSKQIEFMQRLTSSYPNDEKTLIAQRDSFLQIGYELYQFLLSPVFKKLDADKIVLIPDKSLAYFPFEILLTDRLTDETSRSYRVLPYVFHKYCIRYEYSAKFMGISSSPSANNRLLAIAPIFSENTIAMRGEMDSLNFTRAFSKMRASNSDITHNVKETESISKMWGGEAWIEQQISKTQFKLEAGKYDILHLATHAYADKDYPDYAHFELGKSKQESLNEGGLLYAFELEQMNLQAKLAVLSACETGVGKYQGGEGLRSLARAFKYAGCPNIVTSLHKVEDRSTSSLMIQFYEYLKAGQGKAIALQNAKKEHLKSNSSVKCHPFFWSNFILIGDNASVSQATDFKWYWMVIGIVSALLLIFIFYKRSRNTY
ncbi:MAG: CHAT domain-containing tetratricopeptide repeat protein [Bacteroidota bacterium]